MKDNKTLRLDVHHAKTFSDICNESRTSFGVQRTMEFLFAIDAIGMWKS
jgi:hypothetical protein